MAKLFRDQAFANRAISLFLAVMALFMVGSRTCLADEHASALNNNDARAQLYVGYSLLYQEAVGIPKLDWLLKFKNESPAMSKTTQVNARELDAMV